MESDFTNALNVEVQLLYATGHISENNGKGNFSAHLKENDDSGSVHELFELPNFGGLQDAHSAEIHAVLRSHGPKIPGQVGEQINSYEGGCVVNFAALYGDTGRWRESAETSLLLFTHHYKLPIKF